MAHAGNDHPVLAAATGERLAHLDYDYDALAAVMADEGSTTVCLFRPLCRTEFEVRNPFPPGGVVEDPATGAGAAALGGYLPTSISFPATLALWCTKGHHIGAPSRLVVDLDAVTRSVRVSGTATRLALSPYDELEAP